jgi:hypothetical protein
MNQLALTIPGGTIEDSTGTVARFGSIGGLLGGNNGNYGLYEIILWIAIVLMFSWMLWGIFQYLFAGGNKEALGKARSRITWAIVGFVIVVLAFTLQKYVKEIFPTQEIQNVQKISTQP